MTVDPKEGQRLVEGAIAECRIARRSAAHWASSFARDPEGTRRVLASLTPIPELAHSVPAVEPTGWVVPEEAS